MTTDTDAYALVTTQPSRTMPDLDESCTSYVSNIIFGK
jgi:hypothetical protein